MGSEWSAGRRGAGGWWVGGRIRAGVLAIDLRSDLHLLIKVAQQSHRLRLASVPRWQTVDAEVSVSSAAFQELLTVSNLRVKWIRKMYSLRCYAKPTVRNSAVCLTGLFNFIFLSPLQGKREVMSIVKKDSDFDL